MYSIISFSIAACKSLRAPSCSSCSKNGFSASSARFSTEITLFSLTAVSFLFGTSGEAAEGLFFLLKGCAFSHLFIHNFRLYLKEHPDTAQSLNNLGELYRFTGEYAKAEPLYQEALQICRKVLGPEHPHTATNLNNLAALYRDMGEYA